MRYTRAETITGQVPGVGAFTAHVLHWDTASGTPMKSKIDIAQGADGEDLTGADKDAVRDFLIETGRYASH
ncbi:hypothetical protein [Pseudoclavibacter helvolus]|uniref:hypothetical protein n=1 Tax=Pseudoclavibacter helvolus TaxID=255205 RepID=UPI0035EA1389